MAVKYRLIERKNLGNDKTETPKKQYAQVVYGDLVEFETFLEEVADGSGVGSAQNHNFVIRNVVNVLSGAPGEIITTNVLEGMKVVDIIRRIYAGKA